MYDKKKGLSNMIEKYINNYKKDLIESFYGVGTKIKIASVSHSLTTDTLLFEVIIILGETINESVLDKRLIDILIEDTMFYIYPEQRIKLYVKWES